MLHPHSEIEWIRGTQHPNICRVLESGIRWVKEVTSVASCARSSLIKLARLCDTKREFNMNHTVANPPPFKLTEIKGDLSSSRSLCLKWRGSCSWNVGLEITLCVCVCSLTLRLSSVTLHTTHTYYPSINLTSLTLFRQRLPLDNSDDDGGGSSDKPRSAVLGNLLT